MCVPAGQGYSTEMDFQERGGEQPDLLCYVCGPRPADQSLRREMGPASMGWAENGNEDREAALASRDSWDSFLPGFQTGSLLSASRQGHSD